MCRLARIGLVVGLTLAQSVMAAGQTPRDKIVVRFSATPSVVFHEPVYLDVLIENRSRHTVTFDLGQNDTDYLHLELTRPDGSSSIISPPARYSGLVTGRVVRLEPLKPFSARHVLTQWTDFDQIGEYSIHVLTATSFRTVEGVSIGAPPPQELHFKVNARNDARLREVSERLKNDALRAPTTDAQLIAARALGTIHDPVALASIKSLLDKTALYDSVLANGLSRIGTPEAKAILSQMAASPKQERSSIAQDVLRRGPVR